MQKHRKYISFGSQPSVLKLYKPIDKHEWCPANAHKLACVFINLKNIQKKTIIAKHLIKCHI